MDEENEAMHGIMYQRMETAEQQQTPTPTPIPAPIPIPIPTPVTATALSLTNQDSFSSNSPTHVLSPASSLDSEEFLDPDEDSIRRVISLSTSPDDEESSQIDIHLTSSQEDEDEEGSDKGINLAPSQEDQIEKLKEFLTEAQVRGDDVVTQKDADTVKGLESIQLGSTSALSPVGLAARLESAARANMEIEKQTAAGYFPSETVYLQEHTLQEVLDEVNSPTTPPKVLGVNLTATVAKRSPIPLVTPVTPVKSVDADDALRNELDFLFQERAGKI